MTSRPETIFYVECFTFFHKYNERTLIGRLAQTRTSSDHTSDYRMACARHASIHHDHNHTTFGQVHLPVQCRGTHRFFRTAVLIYYFRTVVLIYYFRTVVLIHSFRTVVLIYYFRTVVLIHYFRTVVLIHYFRTVALIHYFRTVVLIHSWPCLLYNTYMCDSVGLL